jgi:hypothetical protein
MNQFIKNLIVLFRKQSVMNKTTALINLNYNKSLPYTIPEILKKILYYTNNLNVTRILYCTSKIFHPIINQLKILKFRGHHISIHPLLPCFKSAHEIQFYHFQFSKKIILEDFTLKSTNNIICDVLLSQQYHHLSFHYCHLQPYIMVYFFKNKSIKKIKLNQVTHFNDQMIFIYLIQHAVLNEIKIKNTNLHLENLNDDHINHLLRITNHLTNKHCQCLCELFKKTKVTKISLIHCGIHDAYFLLYIKFLIHTSIHYINLSDNDITKDYDNLVYECLKSRTKPLTLILSHNPIKSSQIALWQNANPLVQIIF